ncbi:hypothetical protein HK104_008781 [Borealophlyctis nickersoniae]|nr:hypothetical protein HK104_008781 [Borealophlyctis nickersoniae]
MDEIFNRTTDTEDVVEYDIYCSSQDPDLGTLSDTLIQITSFVSQWVTGYIWQKDAFGLNIVDSGGLNFPHLNGRTGFGDCLDDEWFIVFLLHKISAHFPGTVISVRDNDGEFLLVETAQHLPTWLDPSTSKNRVFLSNGKLHIIPVPASPAEITKYPAGEVSLQRAVEIVSGPVPTEAPQAVSDAVFPKILQFPEKAQQNIHRTKCIVPRLVAHLLHHDPQLVAPAVEAFYTRDPIAMRTCNKMQKFHPSTQIPVTVRMTRTLYAQLVSQKFYAPSPFRMPPLSSPNYKAYDIGMKLACGFEMLYADRHLRNLASQHRHCSAETYQFDADPKWRAFQARLQKLGYFRGELPGSRLYKELLRTAQNQFLDSEVRSSQTDSTVRSNPYERMEHILSLPVEDHRHFSQEPEDSDKWMEIDAASLERLLNEGKMNIGEEDLEDMDRVSEGSDDMDDLDEDERRELQNFTKMVGGFKSFVEKESGVEGATFPGDREPDEEDDSDEEGMEGMDTVPPPISFDPDSFLRSMMGALGMSDTDFTNIMKGRHKDVGTESGASLPATPEGIFSVPADSTRPSDIAADSDDEGTGDDEEEMEQLMEGMDQELAKTKIGEGFERVAAPVGGADEEEGSRPIDLDVNLVKNLLESFSSQQGLPGPVENILGGLGVRLPKKDDGQ